MLAAFSYEEGIGVSLVLTAICTAPLLVAHGIRTSRKVRAELHLGAKDIALEGVMTLYVALIQLGPLAGAVLLLSYSVANPALQLKEFVSLAHLETELRSQVTALRIASLISSISLVMHSVKTLTADTKWPTEKTGRLARLLDGNNPPELADVSSKTQPPDFSMALQLQWIILVAAAYLLWFAQIDTPGVAFTGAISLVFFFIVDDWALISYYSARLKGHIFRPHMARILGADVTLAGLLAAFAWRHWSPVYACAIFIVVTYLMYLSSLFRRAQEVDCETRAKRERRLVTTAPPDRKLYVFPKRRIVLTHWQARWCCKRRGYAGGFVSGPDMVTCYEETRATTGEAIEDRT